MSALDTCVGFSDCPCRACRTRRREALFAHAQHVTSRTTDAYCGACSTHARHKANGETNLECSVCRRDMSPAELRRAGLTV